MCDLFKFIKNEYIYKTIYPKFENIFNCFNFTPIDDVKVVILGQDPYCLPNQAHGLSFSVLPGVPLPDSLKNIYKELYNDLGILNYKDGCLIKWARQGILLLNTILTVEKNKPGSHLDIGWEIFTNEVISLLSELDQDIIFIFWGKYAIEKIDLIDVSKNLVISSSHPSSKSAFKSFFGSRPFSKVNTYLKFMDEESINWDLN